MPHYIFSLLYEENAIVERHDMFSGRNYRGDLELLGVFLKITIHVTALYIRFGYARRNGYGPWGHGI